MIRRNQIKNVLFIDVETVSQKSAYNLLTKEVKDLWSSKCKFILKKFDSTLDQTLVSETYQGKAAIYAEFGKIVCISVGYLHEDKGRNAFRVRSFANQDEKVLLVEFADLLSTYFDTPKKYFLCGHNIREFDIPYICRRMVVHAIKLPAILDIMGKRPWQTEQFLDTIQLWKFGDFKNYTSLSLLSETLGIESSKLDLSGDQVHAVYWKENNLPRIQEYCEQDVICTAKVFLKLMISQWGLEVDFHVWRV